VPTRDLVMVLTGDEETTGATARKLIDEQRDWVDAEYALNTDAGGGTLDKDGKALSYNIQTAEKTYASYKLSAFNAGGHSSQPRADNAIYELADALKAVQAHRFPVEWSETTIGYFKAMGATTAGPLGAAMRAFAADPRDAAAADELWKHPAYVGATRTTCVATQLRAGHAENALPQQATATVNCRIFPGVTPQAVRDTLQQVVGEKIEVEVMDEPRYSDASPLRDDVLQAVTAAVHGIRASPSSRSRSRAPPTACSSAPAASRPTGSARSLSAPRTSSRTAWTNASRCSRSTMGSIIGIASCTRSPGPPCRRSPVDRWWSTAASWSMASPIACANASGCASRLGASCPSSRCPPPRRLPHRPRTSPWVHPRPGRGIWICRRTPACRACSICTRI
jgi:hypothetical protein